MSNSTVIVINTSRIYSFHQVSAIIVHFLIVLFDVQTSEYGSLYNPENLFISKEGGGAGNNWASGYAQAECVQVRLNSSFLSFGNR